MRIREENDKLNNQTKNSKSRQRKSKVSFDLPKKKSLKQNNIQQYFNNKDQNKKTSKDLDIINKQRLLETKNAKKSKKKNKLLEIIKLLNSNRFDNKKVFIILERLNKDFIIDILLAIKLIRKRSRAPKKLLKNLLFAYITSNIVVTKC